MPNIPQYINDESTKTGATGPQSTPSDFGAGIGESLQNFGHGLETAAHGTSRALHILGQRNEQAQAIKDNAAVQTKLSEATKQLGLFMANPQNHTRDDFGQITADHGTQLAKGYKAEDFSSPRAYEQFQQRFQEHINNAQVQATTAGYANQANHAFESLHSAINGMADNFRTDSQVPGVDAVGNLVSRAADLSQAAESFRSVSPQHANALHDEIVKTSVLATMDSNPEAAKTILDNSKGISAELFKSLNNDIRTAFNNRNLGDKDYFNNQLQQRQIQAENGQQLEKVPIEEFEQYHPGNVAAALKAADDRLVDTYNQGNALADNVVASNAAIQLAALNKAKTEWTDGQGLQAYRIAAGRIDKSLRMQETDTAGFLKAYNPQVLSLYKKAQATGAPGDIKVLNDTVLKYQGPAPEDATPAERQQYLNRPLADRHVMDLNTAQQAANDINVSAPGEVVKKIGQLSAQYPSAEQQNVAYNDLVTMGKLREEYQAVFLNKDQPWVKDLIGALDAGKGNRLPEAEYKDLENRLATDPTFMKFKAAMGGNNFQNSRQNQGFMLASQKLAEAYRNSGMSIRDAVKKSTDLIFNSELGYATVNNAPFIITRDRGNGQAARTDEDITVLGAHLFTMLHPLYGDYTLAKNVNLASFLGEEGKIRQGVDEKTVNQDITDAIRSNGYWQANPDGQSATLYYKGVNSSFQLTNKDNKPFQVKYADIEAQETAKRAAYKKSTSNVNPPFLPYR